ncbi:MAG: AAA family ATPase [Magnetococcales bacterium]|nr:AAA family ATPase [Magnetococcales bacterium]
MHLQALRVENYRSFPGATTIPLRPLTLFYGYNNTGKSGLLRTLPLLAASVQSDSGPLNVACPAMRGATFNDLRCRLTSNPVVGIGLDFGEPNGPHLESFSYQFRFIPEKSTHIIENLAYSTASESSNYEIQWQPVLMGGSFYHFISSIVSEKNLEVSFKGISPVKCNNKKAEELLHSSAIRLSHFSEHFHWLSSLRNPINRFEFTSSGSYRLTQDGSGQGVAPVLIFDHSQDGIVFRDVAEWFEQTTQHRLNVCHSPTFSGPLTALALTPKASPLVDIPFPDSGEGMGQVLPVIVLSILAKQGKLGAKPVLLLEHPEVHLQPTMHAPIAEVLCQAIRSPSTPQILVETHSENLLLRVQLEIATGKLDPKMVILHWLSQSENGQTRIKTIEFDEQARPVADNWPANVFDSNIQQAKKILQARKII